MNVSELDLGYLANIDKIESELENDCRIQREDHSSVIARYKDLKNWQLQNPVIAKYHLSIVNNLLHHEFATPLYSLIDKIKWNHFLTKKEIDLIVNHLIYNCRLVIVDKCNERRKSQWLLYHYPKQTRNVTMPKQIENGFLKLQKHHVVA